MNICHQRLQNISSACLFKEIFLEELALSRWYLGSRKWDATNAFLSQKCKVGMADAPMLIMLFLLLGANPKGDYERLLQSQNSLCKVWFASSPNFKNMLLKIEMFLIFLPLQKQSKRVVLTACL